MTDDSIELLREAVKCIDGLADQQAMSDDSYLLIRNRLADIIQRAGQTLDETQIPQGVDAELLARAIKFDAGPAPVVGAFLMDEDDDCESRMTVESRGSTGWAVCDGRMCLTKRGDMIYESMPSYRTDQFIKRTRFATPQEAFAALAVWKEKQRKRARTVGVGPKKFKPIPWKEYLAWPEEKKRMPYK